MKKVILLFLLFIFMNFSGFSQTITFSLPDTSFYAGSTVQIPLRIDNLKTTDSIYSFQFKIGFNSSLLEFKNFSVAGFLAENFTVKSRSIPADSFVLWAAHSEPITESGVLMNLEFEMSSLFSYDDTLSVIFEVRGWSFRDKPVDHRLHRRHPYGGELYQPGYLYFFLD